MTSNPPKFIIDSETAQQRLDKYLSEKYPGHTRSHLQQLISAGHVQVNSLSVKTGYKLRIGDLVSVQFPQPEPSYLEAENIPLEIVYQDDDLLVVNKPAGLIVHPGAGHKTGTLVNALLYHCTSLSGINGVLRPGIVHRLDRFTSGLMVVAKNDQSHVFLTRQFETREIIRVYYALIWGVPAKASGQIDTMIDRSHRDRKKMSVSAERGRQAITNYEVLDEFQYFSLLKLSLMTGRTHQIRVHLNHINHPVFGDPEYNGRISQLNRLPSNRQKYVSHILKKISRQALHARELSFIHPSSHQRMSFDSELPEDIAQTIIALKNV